MADFEFCGGTYVSQSIYENDQEAINLFAQINEHRGPDGRGKIVLYSAPGKTTLATLPDALEVRGLWVFSGSAILIAVCGSSVYSITTGFVATNVGTLGRA